jgi:hypothetical protein
MPSSIAILPADQIDVSKWNDCIENNKGLIYSGTAYLNQMTDQWSGLVMNDYQSVMPLPYRKKWGITYLYTPAFTQQLGLTGKYTEQDSKAAFHAISNFAKYGDYFLNHLNQPNLGQGSFISRNNFIISLSHSYEEIYTGFSTNFKRILKKVKPFSYQIKESVIESIHMHQLLVQPQTIKVTNQDYQHLTALCTQKMLEGKCICRNIIDDQNNILSAAILLKDKYRLYNLVNVTSSEGKKLFANHLLMNGIINEFALSGLTFDLEGSEIPGVKEFYEKMGAINQPYYHWHFNQLPFPINILKR